MLLSANARRKILKLPFARELSNWIVNMSNSFFYSSLNIKGNHAETIKSIKNTEQGKRCFIVGNGPSLTFEQLEKIKHEDCFGANRVYKLFSETDWRPKYYVIQDPYDMTKGIYENLDVRYLFVSDYYWRMHGMENPKAICYHIKRKLHQTKDLPFSEEISNYVQAAATVTYSMIQFAVYLGYDEIYLIGMDHTYANITDDKGNIIKRNAVKNHAFSDEKPNEVVANIEYMECAYLSAKEYCDMKNIKIFNATVGGELEIFNRVNFWNLFKPSK
ncbi:DUF115 domain-containing protein [Fictibacillus sp. b24]|uniref:6-hydroxymethylpterin diphosphokinase MptE-like protein n=1 Tax=Fictibacillus sp. b24 TaxID=3055863 RepID=UPI0025A30F4C|nr:6-hydroxymethylpterin diphosphokinase MptE-like protein [Fictibacillus sp. b24]MDM5314908.1 DUF115 domain-containing protein [Fictibacillus sp. b24]